MCHVTQIDGSYEWVLRVACKNDARHTYEWVMSHV